MSSGRAFLNQFTVNAENYDTFIRGGLAPWNDQFKRIHERLDAFLGITH